MKLHIVINTDNLTKGTLAKLLDALYIVEDQSMYKCKSVSKSIDTLQNILYGNKREEE